MHKSDFERKLQKCVYVDAVIEEVLLYVRNTIKCDACAVALYDEVSGNLVLKNKYTWGFAFFPTEVCYSIDCGITGKAVKTKEPIIIGNIQKVIQKEPSAYILYSSLKVKSSIAVPIIKGDRTYGAITADSKALNHFQEAHINQLMKISPQIGQRVYRLQTDEQNNIQRKREERTREAKKTIQSLIKEYVSLENEGKALPQILDLLYFMAPFKAAAIFSRKPGENDIVIVASRGLPETISSSVLYNLSRSPVNDILEENSSILEMDASSPIKRPQFCNLLELIYFSSCIATTYEAGEEEKRAIFLFHSLKNQYTLSDLSTLWAISVLLSILWQRQSLAKAIQRFNQQVNIGEMLPGVVHEVKNAQMSIAGLAKELGRIITKCNQNSEKLPDFAVSMAQTIENSSIKLHHRLDEFLVASMQDKKTEFIDVDINQIITRVILSLKYLADQKGILFEFLSNQDQLHAVTNPTGLQQVLINLILNAIQILNKGNKITVKTNLEPQEILPIIIKVEDNGPGIHAESLDKIFKPYYSTKGGTGMGLATSKNIITELGGSLTVESIVHSLTTFQIRLPKDSIRGITAPISITTPIK